MDSAPHEALKTTLDEVLDTLVQEARQALGEDLQAVLMFGSAAEGRLRATSDVNLLFVLTRFELRRVDALRATLRMAYSAIRAKAMFMLRDELPEAASLFAVKFHDMKTRHRVLYGADPLTALVIDQAALRRRLCEVLLDLAIRLRERYMALSLRDEQLVPVLAEAAAPLRAAALAWLTLCGRGADLSPRQALLQVAQDSGQPETVTAVAYISQARESLDLPAGAAGPALLQLSQLASDLRAKLGTVATQGGGERQGAA